MSENKSRQDLSRYDALTTEELEQILRADALITDEDEAYLEMIVYVAEVYAQRKKNETAPEPQPEIKRPSFRRILRPLAAVAAVVALVFCGTITAKSMGYDLWGTVAEWTSSVFRFKGPATTPSDADPLEAIERMKPTWLPEGFALVDEKVSKDERIRYHALYKKGGASISLTYGEGVLNNTHYSEKNEGEVEVYEANGITFYIFKNYQRTTAQWYVDGLVCHISGDISVHEIKTIIVSIGLE